MSGGAVPEPDSPFLGLTRLMLSRSYRVATIDYEKDQIAERATLAPTIPPPTISTPPRVTAAA